MTLYTVTAISRNTQFDFLDPDPDFAAFVTLSVNFGSELQPDIRRKYFREDRDNTRFQLNRPIGERGDTVPGEWCLSHRPDRLWPSKADPCQVWAYVVEHIRQEEQRPLALKVKERKDRLCYDGQPQWELVYVPSSKRATQPSPSIKSAPQPSNGSNKVAQSTKAAQANRRNSLQSQQSSVKKAVRRGSYAKATPQNPSRSSSFAGLRPPISRVQSQSFTKKA